MPEPLHVRSVTFDFRLLSEKPRVTVARPVHTIATEDGTAADIDFFTGYRVHAGTYLHRDDVAALLESMADEDDDAADALRDAARQVRTRGAS